MSNTETTTLSRDEFRKRFIAFMVTNAGFDIFDDGDTVRSYAEFAASSYFEEQHQESGESPEECAAADMSYWGDD